MTTSEELPPLGVRLTVDVRETRLGSGRPSYVARVRWTDPETHRREGVKRSHPSREAADAWIDPGQTLAAYADSIGERWARAIDATSTYEQYSAGLRLRVLPILGHLPVAMITAGLVDRAIDGWETMYGRSIIKNSTAALVLVLDEAVRDGLADRNPARDRARRTVVGNRSSATENEPANPRELALPDVATLESLVAELVTVSEHRSWGDMTMVLATLDGRADRI